MRNPLILLGFSAAIAWFQGAGSAQACSCGDEEILLPRDDDRVPRNARFWVRGRPAYLPHLELLSPEGKAIDFDLTELAIPGYHLGEFYSVLVATPRQPLEPGTGYEFDYPDSAELVRFEVTDEIDTTAPPVPEVSDVEAFVFNTEGHSCGGSSRGQIISLDAEGIVVSLYGEADDVHEDPPSGTVHDAIVFDDYNEQTSFSYGRACGTRWPGGDELTLRFASYDVAGNLSDISEPQHFTRPDDGGCSVSPHRRSPRSFAALALLAMTLATRRIRFMRIRRVTRST